MAEAEKQPLARRSSRVSLEHHGGGRIPAGGITARPRLPGGSGVCVPSLCCMSPALF